MSKTKESQLENEAVNESSSDADEAAMYCPLIKAPDGKPHPCIEGWCGFWHEASDPKYSRCAIAEISRNVNRLCFAGEALAGEGGRTAKGRKTKGSAPF